MTNFCPFSLADFCLQSAIPLHALRGTDSISLKLSQTKNVIAKAFVPFSIGQKKDSEIKGYLFLNLEGSRPCMQGILKKSLVSKGCFSAVFSGVAAGLPAEGLKKSFPFKALPAGFP